MGDAAGAAQTLGCQTSCCSLPTESVRMRRDLEAALLRVSTGLRGLSADKVLIEEVDEHQFLTRHAPA